VISTDVRALPEINDPECGWIIEVPRNRLGEALYTTEADRNSLSRRIEAGLEGVLRTILSNPESIRLKGEKSLERVRRDHDPRRHGAELTRIYERAVSR
jgi:glycosyltransferase involved in cell wall biosynthesis